MKKGDPELSNAIDRLKAFQANWQAGDVIDGPSHLAAKDLDAIIAQIEFDMIT